MCFLRVNKTCDTLKIFGVKEDDGGTYVCTVDNDDDPQASDTSSVTSLVYCSEYLFAAFIVWM